MARRLFHRGVLRTIGAFVAGGDGQNERLR